MLKVILICTFQIRNHTYVISRGQLFLWLKLYPVHQSRWKHFLFTKIYSTKLQYFWSTSIAYLSFAILFAVALGLGSYFITNDAELPIEIDVLFACYLCDSPYSFYLQTHKVLTRS